MQNITLRSYYHYQRQGTLVQKEHEAGYYQKCMMLLILSQVAGVELMMNLILGFD